MFVTLVIVPRLRHGDRRRRLHLRFRRCRVAVVKAVDVRVVVVGVAGRAGCWYYFLALFVESFMHESKLPEGLCANKN